MVSYQDKVRTKLQTKVFDRIGMSVAYKTKNTSSAYDERGDLTSPAYTTSTITVVPYTITKDELQNQTWGNIQVGTMWVAIPYTTTVSVSDLITIDSDDYRVTQVSPNYLPGNVVTIAMINKVQ